ncbi:hypothetical protein pb186bvf_020174 [Paramecium bursaria]
MQNTIQGESQFQQKIHLKSVKTDELCFSTPMNQNYEILFNKQNFIQDLLIHSFIQDQILQFDSGQILDCKTQQMDGTKNNPSKQIGNDIQNKQIYILIMIDESLYINNGRLKVKKGSQAHYFYQIIFLESS